MKTKSLWALIAILFGLVVIFGLIPTHIQQKWVAQHFPRLVPVQSATVKPEPWIAKGDIIWRGRTRNNLLDVELGAMETVQEPGSRIVRTRINCVRVDTGFSWISVKERQLPGFEPSVELEWRIASPSGDFSDVILIPGAIFRGKGKIITDIPEITLH